MASTPDHLNALKKLDLNSLITLPLRVHGRMLGVITFARCSAARRFAPVDLALAEDLARRAAVAVDNARLYGEAQSAARMQDQSLSITLHEIKTPLTIVQNATHLLKRRVEHNLEASRSGDGMPSEVTLDPAFVVRQLQSIEHATQRLITHINELMDITQIQSRSLVLSPEPVNLSEILSEVVENAKLQQQSGRYPRNHQLELVPPPNEAVLGSYDRGRIEQVLFNLIDNAIKYSPRGGTIRVSLAIEDEDHRAVKGPYAHIAVHDQGIGIPPADQERIFQPFARGSNATTRNFSGIGVGLAISKEIVERHGGRIWAESAGTNQGSTFHVILPIGD
jgi:signal transduction histidine kinase